MRPSGLRHPAVLPAFRVASLALLVGLSACAGKPGEGPATQASASYHQLRPRTPPGPAHDPWGPWISEASQRFDVPQTWIREVMAVESAGRSSATSPVGAMGLMQVMPPTYAELRDRYGLGDDPYHPYDNIMAGTAYLREMYDRFASPGFLAAYNGGPRRFEDYLWRRGRMPDETRNYVAKIAPRISGVSPARPAPAEIYAAAWIPEVPPRGARPGGNAPPILLAQTSPRPGPFVPAPAQTVVIASVPIAPPASAPPAPLQPGPIVVASAPPPPPRVTTEPLPGPIVLRRPPPERPETAPIVLASAPAITPSVTRFRLVSPAQAATGSTVSPGQRGGWSVQVGAFATEAQARFAAETARRDSAGLLSQAAFTSQRVTSRQGPLVRARLEGLSRDTALAACERIESSGRSCIAVAPDA